MHAKPFQMEYQYAFLVFVYLFIFFTKVNNVEELMEDMVH